MDDKKLSLIVDDISNKMIKIGTNKKKTFLEVFDSLIKENKTYKKDILLLLPSVLASKGYEIENTNYFNLIKY